VSEHNGTAADLFRLFGWTGVVFMFTGMLVCLSAAVVLVIYLAGRIAHLL
jgi:hypothetical protein